ncbi:MAG: hypothetical protein WDM92_09905 [Caulobacteraceae bacterium]
MIGPSALTGLGPFAPYRGVMIGLAVGIGLAVIIASLRREAGAKKPRRKARAAAAMDLQFAPEAEAPAAPAESDPFKLAPEIPAPATAAATWRRRPPRRSRPATIRRSRRLRRSTRSPPSSLQRLRPCPLPRPPSRPRPPAGLPAPAASATPDPHRIPRRDGRRRPS